MIKNKMIEVDFEELDYFTCYTLHDKPFTGIAYEKEPDGVITSQTTMLDGMEHGEQWEYYSNGNKKSFDYVYFNRIHGYSIEWHKSGIVKLESLLEYAIIIWQRKYNEKGELILNYTMDKDDFRYDELLMYRKKFNWPIADSKIIEK